MKIAICLHGLSDGLGWKDDNHDCLQEQYQNLKEQLVSKYDVDFFVHTWNESKRELIQKILQPKKMIIETINDSVKKKVLHIGKQINSNQKILDNYNNKLYYSIYCKYSRFYSEYQSDILRQEYEKEHGFTYDLVLHLRFIIGIEIKIDLNTLDLTKLYTVSSVSHKQLYQTLDRPIDYILMGNSQDMKLMATMWFHLDKFLQNYNYQKSALSHDFLTELLKVHHLTNRFVFTKISEIYAFKFSFSPHDKKLRGKRPD